MLHGESPNCECPVRSDCPSSPDYVVPTDQKVVELLEEIIYLLKLVPKRGG
jgi:hypothetical protein